MGANFYHFWLCLAMRLRGTLSHNGLNTCSDSPAVLGMRLSRAR